jgi:CRP/FNR family transcriptional regulator, cyclic AMP receptor protein
MATHSPFVRISDSNERAELGQKMAIKLDAPIVQKIQQKVPVFKGMTTEQLMRTLATADFFPIKETDAIFVEGEKGNSFFVLISGEVIIEKRMGNAVMELARLGTGECFGEMSLVGNQIRTATVRAATKCITIRFMRTVIDANPEAAHFIYRNIANILAARLEQSSGKLAEAMNHAQQAAAIESDNRKLVVNKDII